MTNRQAICEKLKNEILCAARQRAVSGDNFPFVFDQYLIYPGLCDVHVHLREPGYFYKESIASGTAAAARGGFTTVLSMPNLDPVPDTPQTLWAQREIIARDALIEVLPFGAITMGQRGEQLADLDGMAPFVAGFSDDGRGVQSRELMRMAMLRAKRLGKIISAHCEDNTLVEGGYIHKGVYAAAHGHRGICAESEYEPIRRDLELVRETGCAYHVCHVSTAESVELIRRAKREGLDVSCETAPHYLLLCDEDLREEGRFKMNPPLRGKKDREALIEGVLDGTIDMIATDHAPHSVEEKSRGLSGSAFGIVGLETAFALMYTNFVRTGIFDDKKLAELMSFAPRRRFGLPAGDSFAVFDVSKAYRIDPAAFLSKGRSTPFDGWRVFGNCVMTIKEGEIIWQEH